MFLTAVKHGSNNLLNSSLFAHFVSSRFIFLTTERQQPKELLSTCDALCAGQPLNKVQT